MNNSILFVWFRIQKDDLIEYFILYLNYLYNNWNLFINSKHSLSYGFKTLNA